MIRQLCRAWLACMTSMYCSCLCSRSFIVSCKVCSLAPWQRVLQSMANRGGARHFAKSVVEVGALKKVLSDFRGYETLSRSSGYDWKGLMHCLPLVEGLLSLCKKAEIHAQPLKRGLTGLLEAKPSLNKTRFVGAVWVQLRQERIVVLLNGTPNSGMPSTSSPAWSTVASWRC